MGGGEGSHVDPWYARFPNIRWVVSSAEIRIDSNKVRTLYSCRAQGDRRYLEGTSTTATHAWDFNAECSLVRNQVECGRINRSPWITDQCEERDLLCRREMNRKEQG
jgi:hypothetical protein